MVAGDCLHDVTVRDVRLELERGGSIVGRVRDDHGDAVADAAIVAGAAHARTDCEGNFRVDGVASGRVRVSAQKDGAGAADDVEVRAGDESRVDLRLR